MKPRSRIRALLIAWLALAACGDNLLADPSFDLWCGPKLCKPWKSSGTISRIKTWHAHDYGASLGKGAVLSQLSSHAPVKCIELDLIADVSARSDVWLEMDFRDDGSSEYKQLIAESHFAKLRYLVKAPSWYDSVRFILRKKGEGRAVLAQIRATSSDDCKGEAIVLDDRPDGAGCEHGEQCASETCAAAPAVFAAGLAKDAGGKPVLVCSQCASDTECAADETCGAALSEIGVRRACVKNASLPVGAYCLAEAACESELCVPITALTHATCAQCESDDACAAGHICGVDAVGGVLARVCHAPDARKLGEICAVDAECQSGACNAGACSECNAQQACKGGDECGVAEPEWLTVEAALCDPGSGARKTGAACADDSDCKSGKCDEPEVICQLCLGADCNEQDTKDCGFLRRLAGTCL